MITRRHLLQGAAATAIAMPSIVHAQNKKFVLRLSHSHTSGNTALDVFAMKLRELAAAKSGGAIDVQVFGNNQLGQEREIVQQVQQGITELMASGHRDLGLGRAEDPSARPALPVPRL